MVPVSEKKQDCNHFHIWTGRNVQSVPYLQTIDFRYRIASFHQCGYQLRQYFSGIVFSLTKRVINWNWTELIRRKGRADDQRRWHRKSSKTTESPSKRKRQPNSETKNCYGKMTGGNREIVKNYILPERQDSSQRPDPIWAHEKRAYMAYQSKHIYSSMNAKKDKTSSLKDLSKHTSLNPRQSNHYQAWSCTWSGPYQLRITELIGETRYAR